ncbi:Galactomannan galactosyltransferase [Actinidia chinensis var. chinensis]|uniref:Galactomannan galactosyltransferase n=1 Tax=Actinidia chinensis var. chinensis TaxID=1590841 RepID=A0A2R6PAT6_ACTCC|nr:Galactomannan galactosyltransferase [Actinidia chinensis var. chinensis]
MAKTSVHTKSLLFLTHTSLFLGATFLSLLIICAVWSIINPNWSNTSPLNKLKTPKPCAGVAHENLRHRPPAKTFYDDPSLSYSFGSPVKNWDQKRRNWLKQHPYAGEGAANRVIAVTGSQPPPCENSIGDHLLLRLFKNKVDYCRIHGYKIFYNNAFLHRKMTSVWAKLPPLRAAMVAHPEAEWIWWLDSDAVITDMEFKLPLEKYGNYNFVINGWKDMIYEKRSWLGLNTGIVLIRNCQWAMEFIETWASMSAANPNHENLAKTVKSKITGKEFSSVIDEQSALVYLMLTEREKWADKVYIENEYSFSGYWVSIVDRLDEISERYAALEREVSGLRRQRGEVVSEWYGAMREEYLKDTYDGKGGWRRPFITHFTGCQPCSGHHDPSYEPDSCWKEMERTLNFADNQVLRSYGFVHKNLGNSSFVSPLEVHSPA